MRERIRRRDARLARRSELTSLPRHPIGRFKASFFLALGYSAETWRQLERDLRNQHLSHDAIAEAPTAYGQKYAIRATLAGPSGQAAEVVSIWVVRTGEDAPRFVTAYPEGGR